MYLIYMGLSLVCWLLVFLWLPETRGLPLEEIGGLFGDTVVLHLTADGHCFVEKEQDVDMDAPGDMTRDEKDAAHIVHAKNVSV
jgi:hypothetical protein